MRVLPFDPAAMKHTARRDPEIDELAGRLKDLSVERQARLFARVLTPELELQLALERVWSKAKRVDSRTLTRTVDTAVRAARSRPTSKRSR